MPGPAGRRSSWEVCSPGVPTHLSQTKTNLWPLLQCHFSSTGDVSLALAQCQHLGCAQHELDAACQKPAKVSPLRQQKPSGCLTTLLPLTSTAVNVCLCKPCHRYPALTVASDLSSASSDKKAFGIGSITPGEGFHGGRVPGDRSPSTHCT